MFVYDCVIAHKSAFICVSDRVLFGIHFQPSFRCINAKTWWALDRSTEVVVVEQWDNCFSIAKVDYMFAYLSAIKFSRSDLLRCVVVAAALMPLPLTAAEIC